MRAMLIDDEQLMLDDLLYWLNKYPDIQVIGTFTQPEQAIDRIKGIISDGLDLPDVIFLDIEMPPANGLEVAKEIRDHHPDVILVFVTAHSSYALKSFAVHPLDYLLKPLQESKVAETLNYIRHQLQLLKSQPSNDDKPLQINCFGHFHVSFSDNHNEIKWGTRRVKELLLYLIDRGETTVTRNEMLHALFGSHRSKKSENNLYVTVHKLRQLLHNTDPEGQHLRLTGDIVLEIAPGICDFTDFMSFARQNTVINSQNAEEAHAILKVCHGTYLADMDYPWADENINTVEIEYERIALGLAAVYVGMAKHEQAEEVLLNLIARNPLSEEGFTCLLDIYMLNKQPNEFIPIFEQYARILDRELDETPPQKYLIYYRDISNA